MAFEWNHYISLAEELVLSSPSEAKCVQPQAGLIMVHFVYVEV